MCKKLIYLVSFVSVLGLFGAAQGGTITFSLNPPTENILQSNPTLPQPSNYRGSDTTKSGQTFTHDQDFMLGAVTFYIRSDAQSNPYPAGAEVTMEVYVNWPDTSVTNGTLVGTATFSMAGLSFLTGNYMTFSLSAEETIALGMLSANTEYAVLLGSNQSDSGGRFYMARSDIDDYPGGTGVYNSSQTNRLSQDTTFYIQAVKAMDTASNPNPANGATDVVRDVVLSWTPGMYADKHDVYFGIVFDDVNDADRTNPLDVLVSQYQEPNSYSSAELLQFGQTYYWRVDEVNAPPDNTIFKGDIWSFTTEPVTYPIAGENITATASSSNNVEEVPENTINRSGLDDNDLHSNDSKAMWLSSVIGPKPTWIQYEFDQVYKLHQMLVWNHNTSTEPVIGFGVKEATIEYSTDGANWTTLCTHEFARALGTAGYAHNTTVELGGAVAKYVKITVNSNLGGFVPQFGLSEVRFLYTPVLAREPNPASGSTDIDVDNLTLGWRAGREAASHEVYFGDSNQAVIDGTAPVSTVTEASYGPLSFDLGVTHYWKVNEVNMAETPTTWEGDVWDFTTTEFLVVDDFESYNDLDTTDPESNRIFLTWLDGYEQPANGSIVGYAAAPFTEQNIVHSGGQSMPLFYDNTGTARYSEAELTLSQAQDWTKSGVAALSLWFSGEPNNVPEQMYVKVNGSKVTYDSDADNLTRIPWQPWNIDLASLGIDLQNVTKLSIGFGDETSMTPGGSGVVFFDDISLYPYSRHLVTPAEPNLANLVAHWQFEGNANDSSGNGLHGALTGAPAFVAGKVGQAISLRGLNDYVEITGYKGILGPNAFSVSAWIKTTYIGDDPQEIVYYGTHSDGQRCEFRVHTDGRIRMGNGAGQVVGPVSYTHLTLPTSDLV